MLVRLIENWNEVDAGQWDRLVSISPVNSVFQSFAWHSAWLKTFQPKHRLSIICVNDNDRLVGVAPLMIVAKGQLKILKFIGTGHSDYCDFLYEHGNKDILREMFNFLKNETTLWDAAALDCIPRNSVSIEVINQLGRSHGLYSDRYSELSSSLIELDRSGQTLRDLIGKQSMQRHYKYFMERGDYQVEHLETSQEICPWLDRFFQQHIARWELKGAKSLFLKEENQLFYRNLVEQLSPVKKVVLTVVKSQGCPVAFHFGFVSGKTCIWYKPSFDPSLSKHSPGEVLLRELLVYADANGFEAFDFTIGEEGFKERFANKSGCVCSYKVYKTGRDMLAGKSFDFFRRLMKR